MMARSVHINRDPFDLRIDRWSKSKWENPFKMDKVKRDGTVIKRDGTRDEVIAKYRAWLIAQIECGAITRDELAALHGKRLGCWCSPQRCHGDVLAEFAAAAFAGEPFPLPLPLPA